jgi:aminoglycoside phosphotransferase (APT) family kinase protein
MTFKNNWEKTDQRFALPAEVITQMLAQALPEEKMYQYEIISGGCANLNIKIKRTNNDTLILRIYLRDKEAAYREQKIAALVKQTVPAPVIHYIGDHLEYRFAIMEYLPGITLRDLLLSDRPFSLQEIMSDAGRLLAKIHAYSFEQSGFFDRNLKPVPDKGSYFSFAKNCLQQKKVSDLLGPELTTKIDFVLQHFQAYYPDEQEKHLVHADFDPANILVNQLAGRWQITGVLDWEFAFSGSTLCDVANMLRYAHHMPAEFESSFLHGLNEGSVSLPSNWKTSIHMLNLMSLLFCLEQNNLGPIQLADILSLIKSITSTF